MTLVCDFALDVFQRVRVELSVLGPWHVSLSFAGIVNSGRAGDCKVGCGSDRGLLLKRLNGFLHIRDAFTESRIVKRVCGCHIFSDCRQVD